MRFVLAALSLAALSACATATGPDAVTRFDRFEAETRDFRRFDRVHIAPVAVSEEIEARLDLRGPISPTARERALGQRDIDRNTAALRDALRQEFSGVAEIADAPGPGVLTVAVTLTQLGANRPTMAEMRQNPALRFDSISIGNAAVRGELREGDAVLATFEDDLMRAQINDPAIGAGMWTEADRYYRQLADKLASLLK